jgi:hypothetical protein
MRQKRMVLDVVDSFQQFDGCIAIKRVATIPRLARPL